LVYSPTQDPFGETDAPPPTARPMPGYTVAAPMTKSQAGNSEWM